ncbi:MAG: DUF1802 family protein [Candidatus Methylacidiphilales bacterium]
MIAAFKEWSLVCSAIARGDTILILRKGGIAEDAGSFSFQHPSFFLLPTRYHAAASKWHWPTPDLPFALAPDQSLTLTTRCDLITACTLRDWSQVVRLAPFHGWTEATIRERFDYADAEAIHVAIVRAYNLAEPWTLPYQPDYGGCKSWVELPDPPPYLASTPALSDQAFHALRLQIESILFDSP